MGLALFYPWLCIRSLIYSLYYYGLFLWVLGKDIFDLLEELYIVVLVELCCLLLEALIIIRKFFRRQIAHRLVLWGVK